MHNIDLAYLELEQQMQATYERQQRDNHAIRVQTEASFVEQENTRKRIRDEEEALLPFALGAMGRPGVFRQLCTYLMRQDLPQKPLADSAWASLWRSQSDRAFVTTMGIDVATFDNLLKRFATRWDTTPITRGDVNPNGEPQIGWRCLDAPSCLGLVLHWLCSTMAAYTLQQLFAITGSVCLRYLAYGIDLLLEVLQEHPEARFLWPTSERKARRHSKAIEKKFPTLKKCIGFLDGLNLPVLVSNDEE
ncbi:hypothetical protein PGT21_019232 [Puccinia graminis f. sp. tritici]|uniref:Uncharacterized protein n=1 Tax=Puccinia graminis f. sp. tritici TaxID=56615 RepID=A0A5B0QIN8_PUCGR|nr:hypothetical protein PGT21_019232 [Puccinia graminis f. sp. tritici]